MPDAHVLITRIVIAGLLGGIIGAEREFRAKIAGTRTNLLVAIGVATTVISLIGLEVFGWIFRKHKAEVIEGNKDGTR